MVVNAPLNRSIINQYYEYIIILLRKPTPETQQIPGDKISFSRESAIGLIEHAYDQINTHNIKNKWIAKLFDKFGVNPRGNDELFLNILKVFKKVGYIQIYPPHKRLKFQIKHQERKLVIIIP